MGIVLVLVGQAIQQDIVATTNECSMEQVSNFSHLVCTQSNASTPAPVHEQALPVDFTYPLLLYVVVGVMSLLAMVLLFRPKYKRLEMEERAKLLAKLQENNITPSSSVESLPERRSMRKLKHDITEF